MKNSLFSLSCFLLLSGMGADVHAQVRAPWKVTPLHRGRFAWLGEMSPDRAIVVVGGRCESGEKCTGVRAGVLSNTGKMLVSPRFEKILFLMKEGFVFEEKGLQGLVDWEGKNLIAAGSHIFSRNGKYLMLRNRANRRTSVHERTGRSLFGEVDQVLRVHEDLIWVRRNGKIGAFGLDHKNVFVPRYDGVRWVAPGVVALKSGKSWGLFSRDGRQIAPFRTAAFGASARGLIEFNEGGACGDSVDDCAGGREGVISTEGRIVLPARYGCIQFTEAQGRVEIRAGVTPPGGRSGVEKKCAAGPWQLFDGMGKPLLPKPMGFVEPFGGSTWTRAVKQGSCDNTGTCTKGKWGLVDRTGRELTGFRYDWIEESDRFPLAFFSGGRWGLLQADYTELSGPRFESVQVDAEAVRFKENGRWGLMTSSGIVLVAPFAEAFLRFENGLARYRENGKWGLITPGGIRVGKPVHTALGHPVERHYRLFSTSQRCSVPLGQVKSDAVLRIAGKDVVWEGRYTSGIVRTENRFGVLDATGRILVPERYAAVFVERSGTTVPGPIGGAVGALTDGKVPAGGQAPDGEAPLIWFVLVEGGTCNADLFCEKSKWGLADAEGRVVQPVDKSFLAMQPGNLVRVPEGGTCRTFRFEVTSCTPDTTWALSGLTYAGK